MSRSDIPAEPSILSRVRSSSVALDRRTRGRTGILGVTAAVFLLVACLGAATSYLRNLPEATSSASPGSGDDTLARLEDYARSIGSEKSLSAATTGKMLPDVGTMIERLAARLKTSPDDAKGWRMLGWSYFYTERYKEAVTAYARAVELDPTSADLKLEYEEAKEKASEGDGAKTAAAPPQGEATGKGAEGPTAEQISAYQAMPPHEREVAIRSMVDGLAARLENSPRDVEGWMRLMRSRVVLGESEIAAAAFRKALSIFKDDASAASRIRASAFELGLKAE